MGLISSLPPVLPADQVPVIFREPNVLTGYRHPHNPWRYYLTTFLQPWHNEWLNVWTHLVAGVYALYKLVDYAQQIDDLSDPYYWPYFLGYVTILLLYAASVCAHGFHSRSELAHYVCFFLDYAGIGLYGVGIGTLHFYYCSEHGLYDTLRSVYPIVIALVSFGCCATSIHCKTVYHRPYPPIRKVMQVVGITVMYLWIILPLAGRFLKCLTHAHDGEFQVPIATEYEGRTPIIDCADPIMAVHAREIAWFIAAGFFYGTNTPHRFSAGTFDIVGHGHQLFHVCISLTTVYGNEAVFLDMMAKKPHIAHRIQKSEFFEVGAPIFAVFLMEAAWVAIYARYVARAIDENEVVTKAAKSS